MTNTELRKRFEIIFTDLIAIAFVVYATGEFDVGLLVLAVQALGFVIFDVAWPKMFPTTEDDHGDDPV